MRPAPAIAGPHHGRWPPPGHPGPRPSPCRIPVPGRPWRTPVRGRRQAASWCPGVHGAHPGPRPSPCRILVPGRPWRASWSATVALPHPGARASVAHPAGLSRSERYVGCEPREPTPGPSARLRASGSPHEPGLGGGRAAPSRASRVSESPIAFRACKCCRMAGPGSAPPARSLGPERWLGPAGWPVLRDGRCCGTSGHSTGAPSALGAPSAFPPTGPARGMTGEPPVPQPGRPPPSAGPQPSLAGRAAIEV